MTKNDDSTSPQHSHSKLVASLQNVPGRYWAWAGVKILAVVWMVVYTLNTPQATVDALGAVLIVTFGIAVCGAILSVVGMIVSAQPTERSQRFGPIIEFGGLVILFTGPFIYGITQLYVVVQMTVPLSQMHAGPMWLGFTLAGVFIVRVVEVWPRLRKAVSR